MVSKAADVAPPKEVPEIPEDSINSEKSSKPEKSTRSLKSDHADSDSSDSDGMIFYDIAGYHKKESSSNSANGGAQAHNAAHIHGKTSEAEDITFEEEIALLLPGAFEVEAFDDGGTLPEDELDNLLGEHDIFLDNGLTLGSPNTTSSSSSPITDYLFDLIDTDNSNDIDIGEYQTFRAETPYTPPAQPQQGSTTSNTNLPTEAISTDSVAGAAFNHPASTTVEVLMREGDVLYPGQSLSSEHGNYTLEFTHDGDLRLHDKAGNQIWSTDTAGEGGQSVEFYNDRIVIMPPPGEKKVWRRGWEGMGGSKLVVTDTGVVKLQNENSENLWASKVDIGAGWPPPQYIAKGDTLGPNSSLNPGEMLVSKDGNFQLIFKNNGNLALHDKAGTKLWSSQTANKTEGGNYQLKITNGQATIFNDEQVIWTRGLPNSGASELVVTNQGRAELKNANGNDIWNSDSEQTRLEKKFSEVAEQGGKIIWV